MTPSTAEQMEPLHNVLLAYGFTDAQAIEIRDKGKKTVWQVNSGGRKMVLKKMPSSVSQTRFITDAASHLISAGVHVPKIVKTKGRDNFVSVNNSAYILMEWIDGKQPDYIRDTEAILSSLAAFHRGSLGFKPSSGSDSRSHLGTWTGSYQKKKNQLQVYAEHANERRDKDEFSEIFLHNLELSVEKIEKAANMLEKSQYKEWVDLARSRGCLCHQDFTPKNIRMQRDGRINVFDIDSITIDIPARDLRKIVNKFIKKEGAGKVKTLKLMASVYHDNYPLMKGQWEVVAADLLFPHLVYGIIDKYYSNRAPDWSHSKYVEKLKQSIRAENNKEEVIIQMLEEIVAKD
ncbi:MAG: Spore coat protein I [Pelotomaculum sp. PtaU1.Bin035]|nr:MAG: Spore coat protein I [Pelotomaculum sp. PtaU1.Bin035]